jgi:hypothetical protein
MKNPLLIVLTAVVVLLGAGLAMMNNACKSSRHTWCAPHIRHHAMTGRS